MVRATYDVQMSFDAGVGPSGRIIPMTWTTVTDVVRDEGIRIHRGMADALARVAGPGTASFTLRNDAGNSGGLLGYYSTGHANCRSGFGYGMPARIIATYSGNTYVLFSGRIQIVDPTAGTYRDRRTRVVIVDMVGEWVDARLGDIDVALNASSFGLLGNVFAAIPDAVAPIALTGNGSTPDSFPYAFDDLGDGPGVLATIEKVVIARTTSCTSRPTTTWSISRAGTSPGCSVSTPLPTASSMISESRRPCARATTGPA
jgi:hypothetical protein